MQNTRVGMCRITWSDEFAIDIKEIDEKRQIADKKHKGSIDQEEPEEGSHVNHTSLQAPSGASNQFHARKHVSCTYVVHAGIHYGAILFCMPNNG